MRVLKSKTLMAGLAATFLGLAMVQSARACDYTSYETTTIPSSYLSTYSTPVYDVDRVVSSPVMIGDPYTVEQTLSSPVVVERDRGWRHHLLNFSLF
jgi:hypothetical protein